MTTQTIYRVLCDAPHCSATTVAEKLTEIGDGWVRVSSTAHLADWRPGRVPAARGRTREDRRTVFDVDAGGFSIHLCPEHPDVFDGHRPTSEGTTADRNGNRYVTVRCSCEWGGARVMHGTLIRNGPGPNRIPERAWWLHLPADLQWYADRERAAVSA